MLGILLLLPHIQMNFCIFMCCLCRLYDCSYPLQFDDIYEHIKTIAIVCFSTNVQCPKQWYECKHDSKVLKLMYEPQETIKEITENYQCRVISRIAYIHYIQINREHFLFCQLPLDIKRFYIYFLILFTLYVIMYCMWFFISILLRKICIGVLT